MARLGESVNLICALDLVNLGIRILLLDLAKRLETVRLNTAEFKAPKVKFVLAYTDIFDDLSPLVLRQIERITDLNGLPTNYIITF